ncbi:MAG: hypothetical protein ABIB93_02350 [Chloroflexota bacterium]
MTTGIWSQEITPSTDVVAIKHLEQAIMSGENWYLALLEAISLWEITSEVYQGHTYRYLIGGEAFDWLVLAERLCNSLTAIIPEDEKIDLLFHVKPPLELPADEFKNLIGPRKYQQYLNYFYGITVEEALIQAMRDEVRKERCSRGYRDGTDYDDEVFRRVYGEGQIELLRLFRNEMGYQHLESTGLTELKEFTYWLFKYRIGSCDPARIASDTKKALDQLDAVSFPGRLLRGRRPETAPPVSPP